MQDKDRLLCEYFKDNDPSFYNTVGKNFADPVVFMNELIRHYQWIYFMGDIDALDLGDHSNKYFKMGFVEILARNPSFRDEFLNYFLNVFKIAYDYEKKAWYKDIVCSILVNNKRLFWFDYVAMYALICSNYHIMRYMLINDFNLDSSIGIAKEEFIKLFDGISNQAFYEEIKRMIKIERNKISKNIYMK